MTLTSLLKNVVRKNVLKECVLYAMAPFHAFVPGAEISKQHDLIFAFRL